MSAGRDDVLMWLKNRFCPKCQGEGWVWAHELYEYHGEGSPRADDTKYRCDHACHFDDAATDALGDIVQRAEEPFRKVKPL